MRRIQGIGAAPGIAIGPAQRYVTNSATKPVTGSDIAVDTYQEWQRLLSAFDAADRQLHALHQQAVARVGVQNAAIFEAQRAFLHDPELRQQAQEKIAQEGLKAETALLRASEAFERALLATDNPLLKERAADLRDVRQRVIRSLQYEQTGEAPAASFKQPGILIADDLLPSDTIQLDSQMALGICTAAGGQTSHTAILARSLGIPAVVGVGAEILSLAVGEWIALDGTSGEVIIAPDPATLESLDARRTESANRLRIMLADAHAPAVTRDGHQVEVAANVGKLADVDHALTNGAEGIGLLRTEFIFMGQSTLPDEETQFNIYRDIAARMAPHPVIIRALDVGGDKPLPYHAMPPEANPFLGYRAIRMLLAEPEVFAAQVRAVLRAGPNVRLMLPMISDAGEIHAARRIVDEARTALNEKGQTAYPVTLGIMVETPAAALLADQFASLVDFFSIGSNDLTQYTLAADRGNPHLAYLYDSLHPAVLRLIKLTVEAAHKSGRWVGLCGELAGQLEAVPLLVGLGVDELSAAPQLIPQIKQRIRGVNFTAAQTLAAQALAQPDAEHVKQLLA